MVDVQIYLCTAIPGIYFPGDTGLEELEDVQYDGQEDHGKYVDEQSLLKTWIVQMQITWDWNPKTDYSIILEIY